ncbi:MAG: response regulator [Clostridia bacterium]|nr:response regulator [Clostridia bacterium]
MKIVIIDDEINICHGLCNIIKTFDESFQIAGCFLDGQQAISFLDNNRVDVIITDIKMTHLSGIDVLKYVHKNTPETYVILLSGFGEFEYAQTAVKYNAYRYMLKPVDIDELNKVLVEIQDKISDHRLHEDIYKTNMKIVSNMIEEFFLDLFNGAISDETVLSDRLSKLDLSEYKDSYVYIAALKILNFSELYESWNYKKTNLYTAITNYILNFDTKDIRIFHYLTNHDTIKFICFIPDNTVQSVEEILNSCFLSVSQSLETDLQTKSYHYLLIGYSNMSNILAGKSCYFNIDTTNNVEDFVTILKVLFSHSFSESPEEYHGIVFKISNFLNAVDNKTLFECISTMNKIVKDKYPDITFEDNLPHERGQLLSYAEKMFLALQNHSTNDNMPEIIQKACQYINQNYCNDISINDIANYVYVHPVYLSRYFKKTTGKSIHNYITQLRMDYAKRYLKENMSIENVAYKTGYKNAKYFSKLFKLYNKVSPSEYKKNPQSNTKD